MMCYKRAWQNPVGLLYNITKTKTKKKKKNNTDNKYLRHIRHSFIIK